MTRRNSLIELLDLGLVFLAVLWITFLAWRAGLLPEPRRR